MLESVLYEREENACVHVCIRTTPCLFQTNTETLNLLYV